MKELQHYSWMAGPVIAMERVVCLSDLVQESFHEERWLLLVLAQ